MRILLLMTALLTLLSAEAAPSRGGPLLHKRQTSGFVPRPLSKSFDCSIYSDRVEWVANYAGVVVKSTRPMTIDSAAVYTLLEIAAQAKLQETRGPVDGPSISFEGYKILPTDAVQTIVLSNMNGGSGTVISNPSEEATLLKRIIDDLCQ